MKTKKEYCILSAIIIALVLYLILRNPDRTLYTLPEIPQVSKGDITKIDISLQGASIVLNKKDKGWYIDPQGYPAEKDKVKKMLDIVEKLTLTALVSESKSYNRYDLHNKKKITVKTWAGDTLKREFDIGKPATSYRHTFVKMTGNEGVYHAPGNFRGNFDHTVESLRDKIVLLFDKNEIHEIQITKDGKALVLFRKTVPVEVGEEQETIWQGGDGEKIDESKLNRFLSTLSNLRCQKYLNDKKKADFTDPIYAIDLKGVREYTLSIFDKKDKDTKEYPAVSSENAYPFVLSGRQADNIMKKPDEFVEKI